MGLVTSNVDLRRFFGTSRDNIVPKDSLKRGCLAKWNPVVVTNAYSPITPAVESFEQFVLSGSRGCDACLLLLDVDWQYLASNLRNAAVCVIFYPAGVDKKNFQNFFHGIIGRLLRSFNEIAQLMQPGDNLQLMTLPLRNFEAPETREIAKICREQCTKGGFGNAVQHQLGFLRRRLHPRRRSTFSQIYAVDLKNRYFAYGKETHARFDTGAPPHKAHCELNGNFRFGMGIPEQRHFNVSLGDGDNTWIEGDFINCHDQVQNVRRRTHLNMFPNDFF